MSIGSGERTTRSRAITAFSMVPALTASRADATAARYVSTLTPGPTENSAAFAAGGVAGAGTGASSIRVIQHLPSAFLPMVTRGTTNFAVAPGLNGSTPIAI